MKSLRRALLLIGAAAVAGLAGMANAAPLARVSVSAAPAGQSAFNSTLEVQPGQVYDYRIFGELAPVNTTNTQGTTTRTITSRSPADGINSLFFKLVSDPTSNIQLTFLAPPTLATPATTPPAAAAWDQSSSQSRGTLADPAREVLGIRPGHASGVYSGGTAPDVIAFGQFRVDSIGTGGTSAITPQWGGTGQTIGLRINGATTVIGNNTTETGADPITGYTPLTLTAVPEPTTAGLLVVAAGALAMRRRRTLA